MPSSAPATTLDDATKPLFWGIDIGGTNIKIGLVDDAGKTLHFDHIPTQESEGPQSAVDRTAAFLAKIEQELGLSHEDVPVIGLGSPGSMDIPRGYLLDPPNLPHWWNFPIRDAFAKATGRPVAFINDANAAAYGEFWVGTGQRQDNMVLLTLGTGVGGGIVVADELVDGENSFGGECGHMIVDPSPTARLCVWGGGRGQLEAYASASAVVDRTRERLTAGGESSISGFLGGSNTELSAKAVYLAAEEGDALALEIVDETAFWLGIGITTIIHMIDPGLVVLGGAMDFGGEASQVGQRFLEGIRKEFHARTFAHVAKGTKIGFASLGGDAGYLGAAGYARKAYRKRMQ
ncbi:ROK family protein [Rosistilla oblonga]|uniref:ROK family protein n=1 Tax=Rosistilla oblonga TaxID=2527990 RepID=UPI003A98732F